MHGLHIDTDFPAGNIVVEAIDGDQMTLHQDLRDTEDWWFYWAFRVRGAAGRRVRFTFTHDDVFTALGPCYSRDGRQWKWLGREGIEDTSFIYAFPDDVHSAFFAFAIPYTQATLNAFLAEYPAIERRVLTTSEGGRPVAHLVLPASESRWKVLLTARHHACESLASYVLEGIFAFAADDPSPEADALRRSVDLHAIPFIDIDGVEQGDQGKNRRPHDHNRDYTDAPIYASIRALMAEWPHWHGEFLAMLDVHCPWVRDGRNEQIFLVLPPDDTLAPVLRFSEILAAGQCGPLVYDPRQDIPSGVEWNSGKAPTSTMYFRHHARMAVSMEFPYALAGGREVTADGARAFGRALARALARFAQEQSYAKAPLPHVEEGQG